MAAKQQRTNRRQTALLAARVLLTSGAPATAEIYKYVSNGVITYSATKPERGPFERIQPSCLTSYIGCELARSDWSRIPLNREAFSAQIGKLARRHGVDPALVRAVVHAESNFNPKARSRAGAQGLMQLMPQTQARLGMRNPFDVEQNLDGGIRLLKHLLGKYRYDIKLAAAAYNAGETSVARHGGVPPFRETRNYVRRVSQLYARYRR